MDVRHILVIFAATAAIDAAAADRDCDKNHYILSRPCTSGALKQPVGKVGAVAADTRGNVYFSAPNVVFRLDGNGKLTRIAGGVDAGDAGDGGPAFLAQLNIPYDDYPEFAADPIDFLPLVGGLVADREGNLFIADAYNNRVRKVDANGTISTVPGSDGIGYPQGLGLDAAGNLYVTSQWGPLLRLAHDGTVTTLAPANCGARFREPGLCVPEQIAVSEAGYVYVPDAYCRIRRIAPDGTVVTIAGHEDPQEPDFTWTCGFGNDGRTAIGAALSQPYGVALDRHGNLFIADTYNHCIRRIDTSGIIDTFAGVCGESGFAGDGGPALDAQFDTPSGVTVDAAGNVYVADTGNRRIRRIDPDGSIRTVAGNGALLTSPSKLAR